MITVVNFTHQKKAARRKGSFLWKESDFRYVSTVLECCRGPWTNRLLDLGDSFVWRLSSKTIGKHMHTMHVYNSLQGRMCIHCEHHSFQKNCRSDTVGATLHKLNQTRLVTVISQRTHYCSFSPTIASISQYRKENTRALDSLLMSFWLWNPDRKSVV